MAADELLVIPQTVWLEVPGGQIQDVPLEEYVKGVVPCYLDAVAPAEALKALAIAIRSEAAVSRRHARDGFDLCSTPHCLVWHPDRRFPASDQAVDWTAGVVIAANNHPVSAPFFEHCDGLTRDGRNANSGVLDHCRSVRCGCGNSQLSGSGIGLCLQGALTMARSGATAKEMLNHYYTRVAIARAAVRGRSDLRQSLIYGHVTDRAGRPLGGLRLALSGPAGILHKATGTDGRFWFGGLPSGRWDIKVKGQPARKTALATDGRNSVEAEIVLPALPELVATPVSMAHPHQLAGTLGYDGVAVTIIDSTAAEQTVVSGSAPEYNPGGFAVPLPPPGHCTLLVEGQVFDLEITDLGVWVRFGSVS